MQKSAIVFLLFILAGSGSGVSAQSLDSILPVRGFCIGAPRPSGVDSLVRFIDEELAPRKVNTLFILVDYHYQFKSHPELTDSFALSNADVKKIVHACARHQIRVIPQINMLGHQGWEEHPGKLLQVYPQFDETPWVKNPVHYVWPTPTICIAAVIVHCIPESTMSCLR